MNRIFPACLFVLLVSVTLLAQHPVVKMIAGDAYYLDGKKGWQMLRVSQDVRPENIIRVDAVSQVILSRGTTNLTITGPVIIKISDVITRLQMAKNSSVTNTLFHRITGKITTRKPTTVVAVRGENKSHGTSPEWADPLAEQTESCYAGVVQLIDKGNINEAEIYLKKHHPGCEHYRNFYQGVLLFQQGAFHTSQKKFIKACKSGRLDQHHFARALLQHSLALYYLGNYSKAAILLEKNLNRVASGTTKEDMYRLLEKYYSAAGNKTRSSHYRKLLNDN